MLVAKNISYKSGRKHLLQDVSVKFLPGKFNLLIGPNGAGKSTLLKILSGIHSSYKGEVFYDKKNPGSISLSELATVRAVLSQNTDIAFPMCARDVVMMGRYPHFTSKPALKDHEAVDAAMKMFGVVEFSNRDYMTLSGGERQRVQFARVLSQIWYSSPCGYRYLFLDEPLTYLDLYYQYHFMNQIQSLLMQQDIVVVGVLHDLHLAAKFADHVVLLHDGTVLASGKKEEVLTREMIRKAYRVDVSVHTIEGSHKLVF